MGRNCIAEVLKSSPRRLVEVYTSQKPHSDALYTELKKKKIAIKHVTKKELSQMVQSESHQAYIAAVKERGRPDMNSFLERSYDRDNSIVLMLNSIYDPQNLGAIIRAGECFGVDLVVYSKNRGADITPVTTKTSAGATELVPIVKVSNLVETMKRFQREGFWAVCADAGEGSQSLYDMKFPEKTLLILGSEGKGIQPLLLKKCDLHVNIPMLGKIDSLNLSQAADAFLNSYRQQFRT
jgi:23S rRNA (guanosine2251-2'-O)-methyltransferase